ncbi:50S ribosomal protein L10 [Candidatus Tremblaya princeps]|uniref:Large ribosomal subunit protein uL10 n=1 Tax=Tremblaya princeps TaxID=189385 RepID=A0A143WNT3_TREPR|nr:50S ribosomal protein L10 [Candidatus Tremblaya princeps]
MRLCSKKQAVVSKARELILGSAALVLATYACTSASAMAILRQHCGSSGVTLHIVRNKLFMAAIAGTASHPVLARLPHPLRGQLLYAFGPSIERVACTLAAARASSISPLYGMELPGRIVSQGEIAAIMNLPPIDQLWVRVTHLVAYPLTQLTHTLRAIMNSRGAR